MKSVQFRIIVSSRSHFLINPLLFPSISFPCCIYVHHTEPSYKQLTFPCSVLQTRPYLSYFTGWQSTYIFERSIPFRRCMYVHHAKPSYKQLTLTCSVLQTRLHPSHLTDQESVFVKILICIFPLLFR